MRFEKDIDIVGGIATQEEGTISGLLTIYGEVVDESTLLVKTGYGFNTPRYTVGTVPIEDTPETTWEKVCLTLESEPRYDDNGNVIPRTV